MTDTYLLNQLVRRITRLEARVAGATMMATATVVSVDDGAGTAVVTVDGVETTIDLPAGFRPAAGAEIAVPWSRGSLYAPQITTGSVTSDGLEASISASIANAVATATTAQDRVDGKVTAWYSATAPTSASTSGALGQGDLWVDTSGSGTDGHVSQWDGTEWKAVTSAAVVSALDAAENAQTTADGKIVTFWQADAPATASEGDIWFDTDNQNHQYRWTSGAWVDARDAAIPIAFNTSVEAYNAATTAQTAANNKNKVTYSLYGPSGSGTAVGDVWFQNSSTGHILGQWQWTGSSWLAQQITDTVIASLNVDKLTGYEIDGIRVRGGTPAAGTVTLGSETISGIANTGAIVFTNSAGIETHRIYPYGSGIQLEATNSAYSLFNLYAQLQCQEEVRLGPISPLFQIRTFTTTLSSAGDATIYHGISNPTWFAAWCLVQNTHSTGYWVGMGSETFQLTPYYIYVYGNTSMANDQCTVTVMYHSS